MQMLSTFSRLEPDTAFADLNPSVFKLKLTEVTGQYDGQAIEMPQVRIMLVYHSNSFDIDEALELLLAAEFDAASARVLREFYPELDAYDSGIKAYLFKMNIGALARFGAEYARTVALQAWLGIGEGALLNLVNYELIGYYSFE